MTVLGSSWVEELPGWPSTLWETLLLDMSSEGSLALNGTALKPLNGQAFLPRFPPRGVVKEISAAENE